MYIYIYIYIYIYYILQKHMAEEITSQEFRLKNIDETRNYFIEEIDQKE